MGLRLGLRDQRGQAQHGGEPLPGAGVLYTTRGGRCGHVMVAGGPSQAHTHNGATVTVACGSRLWRRPLRALLTEYRCPRSTATMTSPGRIDPCLHSKAFF